MGRRRQFTFTPLYDRLVYGRAALERAGKEWGY